MKKLLKWATASATASLLVSSFAFAQTTTTVVTPASPPPSATVTKTTTITPVGKETTVTVVKTPPPGFKVCYHPVQRNIQGTRIVERCGPYGCRQFRITRDFFVTVYKECHIAKSCTPGDYRTYGKYPNKMQAADALDRCQHTVSGDVPGGWRITY
jgi:hypothetical protein